MPYKLVWNITDNTNNIMAIPNLLALELMSAMVNKKIEEYFDSLEKEIDILQKEAIETKESNNKQIQELRSNMDKK